MSDMFAGLQAESELVKALNAELKVFVTFASLAAIMYRAGNPEYAEEIISDAERCYRKVERFLSDPKHSKRLPKEQLQQFTDELNRVRDKLDGLQRFKN